MIKLTAGDMKALLVRAHQADTIDRWCELAVEWMEKAQEGLDKYCVLEAAFRNALPYVPTDKRNALTEGFTAQNDLHGPK